MGTNGNGIIAICFANYLKWNHHTSCSRLSRNFKISHVILFFETAGFFSFSLSYFLIIHPKQWKCAFKYFTKQNKKQIHNMVSKYPKNKKIFPLTSGYWLVQRVRKRTNNFTLTLSSFSLFSYSKHLKNKTDINGPFRSAA